MPLGRAFDNDLFEFGCHEDRTGGDAVLARFEIR
jgi:hypothetical protein